MREKARSGREGSGRASGPQLQHRWISIVGDGIAAVAVTVPRCGLQLVAQACGQCSKQSGLLLFQAATYLDLVM